MTTFFFSYENRDLESEKTDATRALEAQRFSHIIVYHVMIDSILVAELNWKFNAEIFRKRSFI